MRCVALALLALVTVLGCRAATLDTRLPDDHPAAPLSAESAPEPGADPFGATTTFVLPGTAAAAPMSPTGPMGGLGGLGGMGSMGHGGHAGHGAQTPPAQPEPGATLEYTCPMHPEVVRPEPGACPKCGMALRLNDAHAHGDEEPQR